MTEFRFHGRRCCSGVSRLATGIALASVALMGSPVAAQEATPAETAARGGSDKPAGSGLGEIVVTAQKRSENLQRVPLAVSAITAQTLKDQGIRNISSLGGLVPNLQIANIYGDAFPYFSLRGIATSDVSQNQSGPVAVYVDEVYKGLPALSSLQIFDIDRIEVLRGPQGTLYGKNTTGGAVNIFTRQPDLKSDRVSGNMTVGYGRFNRMTLDAGINLPIVSDRLAVRIAGMRTKVDGWVKNLLPGGHDHNGIDDWAFRVTVAARPADNVNLVLRYTQSNSDPESYVSIAEDIGPGGIGFGTGYTRAGLNYDQTQTNFDTKQVVRNKSASARVEWAFAEKATLTTISSYDVGSFNMGEDVDGSPFRIVEADYQSKDHSFSQDVRLAGDVSQSLNWLVGAYFYSDKASVKEAYRYYYEFGGGADTCLADFFTGCRTAHDFQQSRRSLALYSQENLEISDGLKLTLGLRYTKDIVRLDFYRAYLGWYDAATNIEVPQALQTIAAPPVNRLKNENISGKLGLSYRFPSGTLLYASINRGYRGGSFNGAAYSDASEVTAVKPERLDSIEGGVKAQMWHNRLRLNAAAFYYDYRNQQFLDLTPAFLQVLVNAPRSELWGGEIELTALPSDNLRINASASYLHARYREITLRGMDLAGNRLLLAPDWTMSAGFTWTVFDSASGKFDISADTRYASVQYFDAFNKLDQPAYFLHNARISYTISKFPVTISGWIHNIADKKYTVSRYDLGDSFNFQYHLRGRPREFGVELSYNF